MMRILCIFDIIIVKLKRIFKVLCHAIYIYMHQVATLFLMKIVM